MTTAFDLCKLAWGDREGYVCLSTRNQNLDKKSPEYWRDHLFSWPDEARQVKAALNKARSASKDVYWAPMVFSEPARSRKAATPTQSLWGDLDDVDPSKLPKHLAPTVAWQSSPGRYQALWQLDKAIAPKVQQEINQRLTYAIGADKGGWDVTQVLRIPGTHNHKYPEEPIITFERFNGRRYDALGLLSDLPDLRTGSMVEQSDLQTLPNREALLKDRRIRGRTRALLRSRPGQVKEGQRSERLWELECLLAEQGFKAEEIVSLVVGTGWNKFRGRRTEIEQLATEAAKAIQHVSKPAVHEKAVTVGVSDEAEDDGDVGEADDPDKAEGPVRWTEFDRDHRPISWLVADVWGDGEVGFISGLPKSYKSWIALDLAVSVATGTRFLGSFDAHKNNVLLIQEEDPKVVVQDRLVRIGAAKKLIWAEFTDTNEVEMQYTLPKNLWVISNQGFSIDEEWLDALETWIMERDIKLVILDPLMMMTTGGVDEFKAFEMMSEVFKPLKRLRARTQAAICVVHHHIKASSQGGARDMYGSVALWAWEEAALHLSVTGVGRITAERFSKHALLTPVTIEMGDMDHSWHPIVTEGADDLGLLDLMSQFSGGATTVELAKKMGVGQDKVSRMLEALEEKGKVEKGKSSDPGPGRKRTMWTLT